MSNQSPQPHPPAHQEPSDRKVLYSAFGWLGVISIFALVVLIAYVPNQPDATNQKDIDTRVQIRQQTEATQTQLINNYSWVNEAEGVVRIPVKRAMELTLQELRAEQGNR